VPAVVLGDRPRLRQIIVNLLSNAIKFTYSGGIFASVGARPVAGDRYELHFSISDTGAGIPPDQQEEIFDSFHQLNSAATRHSIGTGLGLTIGKRLSDLMGGRMWVESAVGAGSTFHFTILAQAANQLMPAEQPALAPLAGLRLLVVDSHLQSRQAIKMYGAARNMLVGATESPLEALDWLHQGALFDLAIVDLSNAELEAITLLAQLQRNKLPAILLAPLGQRDERLAAHEHDTLLERADTLGPMAPATHHARNIVVKLLPYDAFPIAVSVPVSDDGFRLK